MFSKKKVISDQVKKEKLKLKNTVFFGNREKPFRFLPPTPRLLILRYLDHSPNTGLSLTLRDL